MTNLFKTTTAIAITMAISTIAHAAPNTNFQDFLPNSSKILSNAANSLQNEADKLKEAHKESNKKLMDAVKKLHGNNLNQQAGAKVIGKANEEVLAAMKESHRISERHSAIVKEISNLRKDAALVNTHDFNQRIARTEHLIFAGNSELEKASAKLAEEKSKLNKAIILEAQQQENVANKEKLSQTANEAPDAEDYMKDGYAADLIKAKEKLNDAHKKVEAQKEAVKIAEDKVKDASPMASSEVKARVNEVENKAQKATKDLAVRTHQANEQLKANILNLAVATNNSAQKLQVNIDANKAAIKANKDAIAHNAQAIESNSRRIHNLDKREQRHMAQNAALAGLFQPYSIGRVNVTAAMGQYRSNNAFAIGAGYRFDNNLAVKAGFSMSTNAADDAAYNVGVNYEF